MPSDSSGGLCYSRGKRMEGCRENRQESEGMGLMDGDKRGKEQEQPILRRTLPTCVINPLIPRWKHPLSLECVSECVCLRRCFVNTFLMNCHGDEAIQPRWIERWRREREEGGSRQTPTLSCLHPFFFSFTSRAPWTCLLLWQLVWEPSFSLSLSLFLSLSDI